MKRLALVLTPLIMLLLLTPATTATELGADMSSAIEIWNSSITLKKSGAGPHNFVLNINIGQDDLQRILSWPGDIVYVVFRVTGVDYYSSAPPQVNLRIYTGIMGLGSFLGET